MAETDFDKELDGTTRLITSLNIKEEPISSSQAESCTDTGVNGDKAKFNKLIVKAKELVRQGQLERALRLFEKAYKIHENEKLWRKIEKLKAAIERYREEEEEIEDGEDDGMCEVGDGFYLPAETYRSLYSYQREGVLWFWRLYQQGEGGILGDDMGLGKTIQVVTFLAGMFDAGSIKSALIVMPVSLLKNWESEFAKWAPGIRVELFHGSNKNERMRNLEKIQRRTGVCLTTYGLVVSSYEALSTTSSGSTFTWDYIILDEGHKIKNQTKTSKNIREIPAKNHFILTGTPVQNNLREMWALFDFACEGKLLGTSRTFKEQYENPIVRARERDASSYEIRVGMEMSESLRKLIEPHFLRRTKAMVLDNKEQAPKEVDGTAEADKENCPENLDRKPEKLPRKNDFIIWLYLSDTQQKIYSDFLSLERVKELLMSTRSPLVELNVLKKICDHPRLLSTLQCDQLGLNEETRLDELDSSGELDGEGKSFATQPKGTGPSDKVLTQESGKMVFLVALLDRLKAEGHRCLVFSQSRKMLDIIQRVITHMGHKVLRIDGTISKTADRQHLIDTFQTDKSYSCFLLTTQVGGVGITLTAADRVVIFDPSWNPATDAQAVDRAYRIGQKKNVIIYRLITCGTLEEKIYRKQIFKDALMKQTTGVSKDPFRYFTRQELRDLFILDDPYTSKTQIQLEKMHADHRETDGTLDEHIAFIESLNIFGISDHDLMYSKEAVETTDEVSNSSDKEAIQARVLRAQNLMAAESRVSGQIRPSGPYPPAGISPEEMAVPQGLRHSLPLNENKMSARQKIQAKIDSERFFVPKKQDTTRFQPGQFAKNPLPVPVVDLCSPSPVKTSPPQYPVETTPDPVQNTTFQDPVELSHLSLTALEVQGEQQGDGHGLEKELASLHIENHSLNSPSRETPSSHSTEKQPLVESIQSFDEAPSQKVSRCPTGKHVSNNVNIFKCACLVSEEEVERYDAHIDNGRRLESEGKAEEAFKQYMCALELKDSDIKLHLRTLQLAQGFKELLY